MKKILIMNSYDEYIYFGNNKGAEAVLVTTIEILKKYIQDAEFVTNIQCTEALANKLNLRVIRNKTFSFKIYSPYTSLKSTIDLSRCALWKVSKKYLNLDLNFLINNKKLKEFAEADLVVHLGMDLYSSDFGNINVFEESKNILISTILDKPVILWAESIGPFKGAFATRLARFTLKDTDIISIREKVSEQHLKDIGITNNRIKLTADPAFLLTPSPKSRVDEILKKEGVKKSTSLTVGFTPSVTFMGSNKNKKDISFMRWMYLSLQYILPERIFTEVINFATKTSLYSNSKVEQQKYIETVSKFIDKLVDNLDCTVVLIPHVLGKGALIEEKSIANKIWQSVKNQKRVYVIKNNYMADEVKGIIGQCDLFIGGRMHANIAALSQGIPSVGLAYSHKFMGIMSLFGQEKYVCNELNYDDLLKKIEDIINERDEIASQINSHLNDVKKLGLLNGKLATEIITVD